VAICHNNGPKRLQSAFRHTENDLSPFAHGSQSGLNVATGEKTIEDEFSDDDDYEQKSSPNILMNNTYCDSGKKPNSISKQASTVGLSCLKKLSIANKTGFETKVPRNQNHKLPPIV
jgi:hypothetical protein